jgi:glutamate carboxypeptidase
MTWRAAALALLVSTQATADLSKPLVDRLRELVEISSGSSNTDGVDRVLQAVEGDLKQLGFQVERRKNRLLVANRPAPEGGDSRVVTLLSHADTVFEDKASFRGLTVSADGKTATGPGAVDNKGGIIVMLEGLRKALLTTPPSHALRVLVSPSEETGAPGLHEDLAQLGRESWLTLTFEPAYDEGSIIRSRRGDRWYHIRVAGKEAHAGRAYLQGVNACLALSRDLVQLSALTDLKRDLTVSIGHLEGGKDKFNIVCGAAEAKVDTRFASFADRDELNKKIEAVLKKIPVPGAKVDYTLEDDSPPFAESPGVRPFLRTYLTLLEEIEGRKFAARQGSGASDANYMSRPGSMIIDGLGPYGGKMHTDGEFVVLSSLETRAEALARFLRGLKPAARNSTATAE